MGKRTRVPVAADSSLESIISRDHLLKLMECLSRRNRMVILALLNGYSQADVARAMRVPQQRVHQIVESSIRKMRARHKRLELMKLAAR